MDTKSKVAGIDLAGLPKNDTGLCILKEKETQVKTVKENEEIFREIERAEPELIGIDGPLSKPKEGNYRECDRKLSEHGSLPPLMSHGMRKLTERAIEISKELEEEGYSTVEVFPSATADLLGFKRKKGEEQSTQKQLLGVGLKGTVERRILSMDEIDAVLAALTAGLHLQGRTRAVGDKEGRIAVPDTGG